VTGISTLDDENPVEIHAFGDFATDWIFLYPDICHYEILMSVETRFFVF